MSRQLVRLKCRLCGFSRPAGVTDLASEHMSASTLRHLCKQASRPSSVLAILRLCREFCQVGKRAASLQLCAVLKPGSCWWCRTALHSVVLLALSQNLPFCKEFVQHHIRGKLAPAVNAQFSILKLKYVVAMKFSNFIVLTQYSFLSSVF